MKRILLLILFLGTFALANNTKYDALFDKYGKQYNINPAFLKELAKMESGLNQDLRKEVQLSEQVKYVFVGLFQINAEFPEIKNNPKSADVNTKFAGYILNKSIKRFGYTEKAIESFDKELVIYYPVEIRNNLLPLFKKYSKK